MLERSLWGYLHLPEVSCDFRLAPGVVFPESQDCFKVRAGQDEAEFIGMVFSQASVFPPGAVKPVSLDLCGVTLSSQIARCLFGETQTGLKKQRHPTAAYSGIAQKVSSFTVTVRCPFCGAVSRAEG